MSTTVVYYGYIGNLITGVIINNASSNTIFVTTSEGLLLTVVNKRIPNTLRMPVTLGFDSTDLPTTLQVLDYWSSGGGTGSANYASLNHHAQHEFPGDDVVYVKGEQFYPSLFMPNSSNPLCVDIHPGAYRIPDGWQTITWVTTLNLAGHIPTAANTLRYAMIVVNINGDFVIRDGATVSNNVGLSDTYIPEPTSGDICICAVRLFNGQTAIHKDKNLNDFIDLRFSGGGGGNGGSLTAQTLGGFVNQLSPKVTPVDGDVILLSDSADSYNAKKMYFLHFKNALKTLFDNAYAAIAHTHAANDIASGIIDGDRLPEMSGTKLGGVPPTGTPSGKYLKDDGSWTSPPSGGGGSSAGGVTVSNIVKVVKKISFGELATASASYSDVDPTNLKIVFTKQQDSTDLVIDAAMSAYTDGVSNAFMIGVNDGTTDHDIAFHFFNPPLTHMLASGSISLSGLSAGTYSFTLRWRRSYGGNTIHANGDDGAYLKITETGIAAATSGGAGILGGQLVDCTSQIDGVTNHFTLPHAAASVTVMVDGITQSPSDVTLDYDGFGFTLPWVPTISDTNHLFAFCSVPMSTSISHEYTPVVYTGGQAVHDLVDLTGLSITKNLENGVYYRWKFFFAGSKSETGTLGVYITDDNNNKLNNGAFSIQAGFTHSNFVEFVEMGTGLTVTRKIRASVDTGTFSFASSSANFTSSLSVEKCGSREITVNVNPGSDLPDWVSGSPNNPPSVSNPMDDEFEDASLNSKWAWVNQSGSTASFSNSCVLISAPPNTAIQITGIEQAIPSGNAWKVRTKLSLTCQYENFVEVGILLRDSSSNKVFSFCLDGRGMGWKKWNAPNSWNSEISQIPVMGFPTAQFVYLQLVKISPTSYDFYYSGNGIGYLKFLSNIDVGGWLTPDKIGVYLNHCTNNSLGSIFTVDWFRRIE